MLSGRADCYFALVFQAKKLADAGKLAGLAISAPRRSSLMPEVATEELGFPNSHYNFWVGALAPAKTPPAVLQRLHREVTALVESREVGEQIRKLGGDPLPMTIGQFEEQIARELRDNAELIRRANIKAN